MNKKVKPNKHERGITMIALIVMVIILIILAVVSIQLLTDGKIVDIASERCK